MPQIVLNLTSTSPPISHLRNTTNPQTCLTRHVTSKSLKNQRVVLSAIASLRSLATYYLSSLQLILDLIPQNQIYSQQAVDTDLIHCFLLDVFSLIFSPAQDAETFHLTRADDKGDHILVDDSFSMTGFIDWEWAHTACQHKPLSRQ